MIKEYTECARIENLDEVFDSLGDDEAHDIYERVNQATVNDHQSLTSIVRDIHRYDKDLGMQIENAVSDLILRTITVAFDLGAAYNASSKSAL